MYTCIGPPAPPCMVSHIAVRLIGKEEAGGLPRLRHVVGWSGDDLVRAPPINAIVFVVLFLLLLQYVSQIVSDVVVYLGELLYPSLLTAIDLEEGD